MIERVFFILTCAFYFEVTDEVFKVYMMRKTQGWFHTTFATSFHCFQPQPDPAARATANRVLAMDAHLEPCATMVS